jgi:hypothetical protein
MCEAKKEEDVRSTYVALAFSLLALRERLSKVERPVRTFENFSLELAQKDGGFKVED